MILVNSKYTFYWAENGLLSVRGLLEVLQYYDNG